MFQDGDFEFPLRIIRDVLNTVANSPKKKTKKEVCAVKPANIPG